MTSTTLEILGDARGAGRVLADVRGDHTRATTAMGAAVAIGANPHPPPPVDLCVTCGGVLL